MRIAVLFLAGMAFVTGFNQRAQKLDQRSRATIPAATAEEFAAYQQRWRANLLGAQQPLPPGVLAEGSIHR